MVIQIYLSGGTVTDWQRDVMDQFVNTLIGREVEFYNPADFQVASVVRPEIDMYGPMDKLKIDQCDIVFGYLEATNPTPINVALEMGYAIGLGKITVLCNEWTEENFDLRDLRCLATENGEPDATWFKPHYVSLLNRWVDFVESDFGIAIELLKKIVEYEVEEIP